VRGLLTATAAAGIPAYRDLRPEAFVLV
jgi:hypothetical protein